MEANVAYYCLLKLHKWPHEFLELDIQERAVVVASIQKKMEADKKRQKEAERKIEKGRNRKGRRGS